MHSVFETSKKYQNPCGIIATCLFADSEVVVMRWDNNRHTFTRHPSDMRELCLTLYVPPRKEYFNAYKGYNGVVHYGNPCTSQELADKMVESNDYYGRLIMTHHSETEVTVEFHLKR